MQHQTPLQCVLLTCEYMKKLTALGEFDLFRPISIPYHSSLWYAKYAHLVNLAHSLISIMQEKQINTKTKNSYYSSSCLCHKNSVNYNRALKLYIFVSNHFTVGHLSQKQKEFSSSSFYVEI